MKLSLKPEKKALKVEGSFNEPRLKLDTSVPYPTDEFLVNPKYLADMLKLVKKLKIKELDLNYASEIKKWIEEVEYYALEQVQDKGEKITSYKLVEGRSIRKITEPDKVAEVLQMESYEDIYKLKDLLVMGQLEKLVGKKNFNYLVGEFIVKPTGKPVLVLESDKHEEIGSIASAVADFE